MRDKVAEEVVDVLDVNEVARSAMCNLCAQTTFPYVSRNVWTTQIRADRLDTYDDDDSVAVLFAYGDKNRGTIVERFGSLCFFATSFSALGV